MLNAGYKKEALRKCEEAGEKYKKEYESTIEKSTELHENKEKSVVILKDVDTYIHSLSNKPKEIEKIATEVSIRRKAFEKEVEELKIEAKNADKVGKGIAGGGVLAGAGVAAFGPTAAMGVATTFGTASTGTAIAALSGAAQANAALAWLGGGALTAGGAGMAGGEAFLAMAGPVGWAIGGAALVGGGLLANSKNKKIAEKAESQTKEIKEETTKLGKIKTKIVAEIKAIQPLNIGVNNTLSDLKATRKNDYKLFTDSEKDALMELMNSAEALSKRIGVKIS
ncbi:MAG: hypothetical protein PUC55_07615 [Lachnospiraceae bacterium]|nr:hypothetical protein [Lachnospiraceae bacterium]